MTRPALLAWSLCALAFAVVAAGVVVHVMSWNVTQPATLTPRGFAIDPRGKFLLSVGLDSHHMTIYAIRPNNGGLEPVKQQAMGKMPNWIEIVDLK